MQSDGKIIFAGGGSIPFASPETGTLGWLNGTMTRLFADGSLDYDFACSADVPSYSDVFDVHLAARTDGEILLTGIFNTINDQPRYQLAIFSPDGQMDKKFIPQFNDTNILGSRLVAPCYFYPAALDTSGQVVFPALKPNPFTAEFRMWKMGNSGHIEGNLQPDLELSKIQPSLLGTLTERGFWLFRPVNWQQHERTEWSLNLPTNRTYYEFFTRGDPLSAGDAAEVLRAIFAEVPLELCRNAVRLPDGGVILLVQEGDEGRLMRFDKNWIPDLTYTNSIRARGYMSMALQKDGKLLVARGTDLHDLATGKSRGVFRLNADGSIDSSFNCDADERVMCLAVQADGKILVGGFFGKINGVTAPWLARLNTDGSVDEAFQEHLTKFPTLTARQRVPVKSLAAATNNTLASATSFGTAVAEMIFINSLTLKNGIAEIQFQGAQNHAYVLQARDALNSGDWFNLATNTTTANGFGTLRDSGATDSPTRFYRVATP